MRLMISGSREAETAKDSEKLNAEIAKHNATEILHGGARGADTIAKNYANTNGIAQTEIKPDYVKHGKNAPHIRNSELIDLADKVICYYATDYPLRTAGTWSVAQKAKKAGKLICEIWRFGEAQTLTLF